MIEPSYDVENEWNNSRLRKQDQIKGNWSQGRTLSGNMLMLNKKSFDFLCSQRERPSNSFQTNLHWYGVSNRSCWRKVNMVRKGPYYHT